MLLLASPFRIRHPFEWHTIRLTIDKVTYPMLSWPVNIAHHPVSATPARSFRALPASAPASSLPSPSENSPTCNNGSALALTPVVSQISAKRGYIPVYGSDQFPAGSPLPLHPSQLAPLFKARLTPYRSPSYGPFCFAAYLPKFTNQATALRPGSAQNSALRENISRSGSSIVWRFNGMRAGLRKRVENRNLPVMGC